MRGMAAARHILFTWRRASIGKLRHNRWLLGGLELTKVIESVQHNIKLLEPCNVKLGLLDVSMNRSYLNGRIEGLCGSCRDLNTRQWLG